MAYSFGVLPRTVTYKLCKISNKILSQAAPIYTPTRIIHQDAKSLTVKEEMKSKLEPNPHLRPSLLASHKNFQHFNQT